MTLKRIRRGLILVILMGALQSAAGQYQDMFAALATSNIDQPRKEAKVISYIDLFNPLGPNAQSMRNKSYSCINEPPSKLEKGLWIKLGSKSFLYEDQGIRLLDANAKLVKVDYFQFNKALRKTVKALKNLEKRSSYARNMIKTLQNSDNKFVISLVNTTDSYTLFPLPNNRLGVLNNNAYAFQVIEKESLIVDYAPFDKIGSGAEIRWAPEHKKIKLAHELSHAYDANYGLLDDQLMQAYGEIMSAREIRALFHENMIRKEMNIKLRIKANTGGALVWEGMPYTYPLPVPARY
ncbi:M91 family zinc metallopeptidase [Ekhidna sp.]|uniref:M91 family zinc metallopeptidase n=1 Tax=Ekhidna sp. TaxID=2608089 RepID=UPI0032969F10